MEKRPDDFNLHVFRILKKSVQVISIYRSVKEKRPDDFNLPVLSNPKK